jgi:hypothetical protein
MVAPNGMWDICPIQPFVVTLTTAAISASFGSCQQIWWENTAAVAAAD